MSPWECIIRLNLRDTFSGGLTICVEGMVMKTNLTTVPVGVSWLVSKLVARQQKRQAEADANTIDNLERLYQLKEKGVLTNKEFEELKDRMKAKI